MDALSVASAFASLSNISISMMLFIVLLLIVVGFFALLSYWILALLWRPAKKTAAPKVSRAPENPVLKPLQEHWWESAAVFNPAAFVDEGRVHLLYRAMGQDGISRIGYASSPDGIHFDERLPYSVFDWGSGFTLSNKDRRYRPLSYNTDLYASGGGWGGCEDPRAVVIENHVYMTFGIFDSWQSMRLAVTALSTKNLRLRLWKWMPHIPMSPHNETHKNWVLFPEKIHGKFAILHALTPSPMIEYIDSLEELRTQPITSNNHRSGRKGKWDAFVRGAGAPPFKTKEGWLLLYHGMNPDISSVGYKVGAMLLDLTDPTKILYRTDEPILQPQEWYENDWKPGVVYASGAVVFNDILYVYYGGGDKYIAVATKPIHEFLHMLVHGEPAHLQPAKIY